MKKGIFSGFLVLMIAYLMKNLVTEYWDFSSGMNENVVLGNIGIQMMSAAFCLRSANFDLIDIENGHLEEDDYLKESIYSILYSMYDWIGTLESDKNISYNFTFNTWGFGPSLYGEEDPQRYGKTAYKSLTLFDDIQTKIKSMPHHDTFKILEVGSGTGAGGNLISSELQQQFEHINIEYIALDMQLAAIQICKKRHEIHNPSLHCVQGNGKNLPFNDSSFDMVVVSETHIAEIDIDPETKIIIDEIIRVLKNDGYFVWGNALFTHIWKEILDFLPTKGFVSCGVNDHTEGAIMARLGDEDRAIKLMEDLFGYMPIMQWYPKCRLLAEKLILNFYRHPGTNLYNTMVNRTDSYMQICHKIVK